MLLTSGLCHWWILWGKETEKAEHVSLYVSQILYLTSSLKAHEHMKQQVPNVSSLQAIFTLKLSPNAPN